MKKNLLLGALLLLNIALLNAQVPRFVLFEHFTQASCGPCADQNPAFQDAILGGGSAAKSTSHCLPYLMAALTQCMTTMQYKMMHVPYIIMLQACPMYS
ncbi:MAG: hypothetical protein IPL33_10250 [Sphingobacteriales bacterium]|nr:hypothetical protein [Sphingobacteriales bacterium]